MDALLPADITRAKQQPNLNPNSPQQGLCNGLFAERGGSNFQLRASMSDWGPLIVARVVVLLTRIPVQSIGIGKMAEQHRRPASRPLT